MEAAPTMMMINGSRISPEPPVPSQSQAAPAPVPPTDAAATAVLTRGSEGQSEASDNGVVFEGIWSSKRGRRGDDDEEASSSNMPPGYSGYTTVNAKTYYSLPQAPPPPRGTRPPRRRRLRCSIDQCPLLLFVVAKGPDFATSSADCAVCLGELEDRDKVWFLPRCRHVFHPDCIDGWLCLRLTCPVCHTRLIAVEPGMSSPPSQPEDPAAMATWRSGTTIILPLGQGLRDMKTSFSMMVVGFILALFTMGLFWIYYRQCYNLLLAAMSAAATRGNTAPAAASASTAASRRRQEAIDQCPLLLFAAAKGPDFATSSVDCTVCLGELEDREKVQFLPRCRHVFHPDCIDEWLRLRLTCPVCCTRLIATEPGTSSPPPQPEDPAADGDMEGGSLPTEEASGHSLVMAREDETSGTTIILPLGQGLRDMKTSFSMMVVGFILALFTMGLFWIFYRQCYNLLLAATSAAAATRGNTAPTAALSTAASRRRQEAIDQCPLLLFAAAKGPDFATSSVDCAVCLGELEDRDKVRFLPRCQHVFHPDCIDRWLRLRLTCPVCRTRLIAAEPGTSSPPPQPEDPVVAGDVEGGSPPTEEASGHSLVMAREDETSGTTIILLLGQGLRDMKTSFSMMVVSFILALFTMGLFWIYYRQCYNLLLVATGAAAATRGNTAPAAAKRLSTSAPSSCLPRRRDRISPRRLWTAPCAWATRLPSELHRQVVAPSTHLSRLSHSPDRRRARNDLSPAAAGDVEGGSLPTEEASGHSVVMAREDETVGDQIRENDSDDDDDKASSSNIPPV
ncbi:E3 ubiquitin-protein ligase ATL6-like [Senna tora]|uniref:RING-type E3 ubiquitin transferase n=1 Tax=Senna tora TaxID=362788 RepID=A0A834X8L3_9FABA|nr:E3 ubiquitin-protein ligase ATL6-like [Senna tora]